MKAYRDNLIKIGSYLLTGSIILSCIGCSHDYSNRDNSPYVGKLEDNTYKDYFDNEPVCLIKYALGDESLESILSLYTSDDYIDNEINFITSINNDDSLVVNLYVPISALPKFNLSLSEINKLYYNSYIIPGENYKKINDYVTKSWKHYKKTNTNEIIKHLIDNNYSEIRKLKRNISSMKSMPKIYDEEVINEKENELSMIYETIIELTILGTNKEYGTTTKLPGTSGKSLIK